MRLKHTIALLLFLPAVATAGAAQPQEEAAALAAAGRTEDAIGAYRALLRDDPGDRTALKALPGLLEAAGRWQEAVPLLEQWVALEPQDPDALLGLGRVLSWRSGDRGRALSYLGRACETGRHDPRYCIPYAEVLSWEGGTRPQAVARLREVLASHPESVPARAKLGEILSWNANSRAEALALFDEGLRREPQNRELLLASASVLAWRADDWAEALRRYDRVLRQSPEDAEAVTGKAQLLAWQGRTADALKLYAGVLAKDPKNVAALRGKAEILNWKGDHGQARALSEAARAQAPSDAGTLLELARADIGLGRYSEAEDALAGITGAPPLGFEEAQQEIHRGLGTYFDLGYTLRTQRGDFNSHRLLAAVSTPVGRNSRLTFRFEPTRYEGKDDFNTSFFEGRLDSRPKDALSLHAEVGVEAFNHAPDNFTGGAGLSYRPETPLTLHFELQRQPVQESFLSIRGKDSQAGFLGQVHSNLATAGLSYGVSAYQADFSLDVSGGTYTGRNLDSNNAYFIQSQLGKSLRGEQPYLRLAYNFSYAHFDHNADVDEGEPLTEKTGGYYSPRRFLLNQGVLDASHRFTPNLLWRANLAAGVQNAEVGSTSFSHSQFAYTFQTSLLWRVTPLDEILLADEYLHVFDAFHRNLLRLSWRHYL